MTTIKPKKPLFFCFVLLALLLVFNCEHDDNASIETTNTTNTQNPNNTLKLISPQEFEQNHFFEQLSNTLKNNSKYLKTTSKITEYEFLNQPVIIAKAESKISYTATVKEKGKTDSLYTTQLVIQEINNTVGYFLIQTPKHGGNLVVTDLNNSTNTNTATHSKKNGSPEQTEDFTICAPIDITTMTTITSTCCGSTGPGIVIGGSTTTTTVCWRIKADPIRFTPPSSHQSASGHGNNNPNGIPPLDTNEIPIYIYEGEPYCESDVCTPRLYWTLANSSGKNTAVTLEDDTDNTIFIDVSQTKKIDPVEELKCFDTTKPAKLTVYVEQAIENSREVTARLGHVFIGIEQDEIIRNLGFYPDNGGAINLIKSQRGEIHDNSTSPYHISISKNISTTQLKNIITYIKNYPNIYNVRNYNCTDFGIEVADKGGLTLPKTTGIGYQYGLPVFKGRNPGDLGEDIRELNLPTGVTRNTTGGNAPTRTGNCN